ncbi:7-cyano-7-deazaguanine synthase [Microvirga calopogonii]|uniref:7-cyano-7-deazaguanine synthase n=1 Tax=Microvirga calopogonii TaxID=2078013 RepID=UPI000E0D1B58
MKTLVIRSTGLDSGTLAHKVAAERTLTRLVSFDYGQRHKKELDSARACAVRFGVPHDSVDISALGRLLAGSALTTGEPVPERRYAEDTMRILAWGNKRGV